MSSLRSLTTGLCFLVLLAPACGDATGGSTAGATDTGASETGSVDPTETADDTTETADDTTGDGTTAAPTSTTTDDSTSTGDTTGEPATATDTGTTGEPPGPCDDLIAPDPANMYIDFIELVPIPEDQQHQLQIYAADGDNSWDVVFFDLGPDPTPGVYAMHPVVGTELLTALPNDINGTATLELVTVTTECVTGRISDLVVEGDPFFVDVELPGGFVATRRMD